MIKKLITIGLPLLAPVIVYLAYMWATYKKRMAEEQGQPIPPWQEWPWTILVASGVFLMATTLIGLNYTDRTGRDAAYTPPTIQNGEVVPGDFSDN